ncbi:MAG: radical SAM family heme chaperone HemW [Chloroflexi bacterium]|nr:radical SAM family heme chaperone HemW [Chloroflexota bacterium]
MQPHSLYLHIPFCKHRCGYCDFNTYAGMDDLIPAYANALQAEIRAFADASGQRIPIHTIYFGGGTPSLMPAKYITAILESIDQRFELLPDSEITLEVNPGTVDLNYFRDLHKSGVNRISMGVQSANPEELRLLERQHGYADAIHAVKYARQAGFDNLSVDLIFGLPYQKLSTWQHSLELALALNPEHISLYALTIEHGTPLGHWVSRGLLPVPNPDTAADMYEWTMQHLEGHGFNHYEISNWARRSEEGAEFSSRHNLQYWRNLPYIGFGAGAHGYIDGMRIANVLAPTAYIERCTNGKPTKFPRTPASVNVKPIDTRTEMGETLMMGLRLIQEGVSNSVFQARFGKPLTDVYREEIEELGNLDLLEWAGVENDMLRLTPRGRLLGNQVFVRFI